MDWAPIAEWLTRVLLPALGSLLLAALFELARTYIARLKDERLRRLLQQLVAAAEQVYGPGRGAEKRAYVTDRLREQGIVLGRPQLEAEVYELTERQKLMELAG